MWPPLFSSTALTLLGMEFTRASQVAAGVLFHSSMMTSQSWWLLETLYSSTFRLNMPYRLPLPSASLARQWSSCRCVWSRYHVGILPSGPVSEGRGSCSASVCHSTCWHSWFPQRRAAEAMVICQVIDKLKQVLYLCIYIYYIYCVTFNFLGNIILEYILKSEN